VHPRTRQMMRELPAVKPAPNLHLVDPIGYIEFLGLQRDAVFVITDSGGIQEETTFLGVPCLTVRENTERPVTVTIGPTFLSVETWNVSRKNQSKFLTEHQEGIRAAAMGWESRREDSQHYNGNFLGLRNIRWPIEIVMSVGYRKPPAKVIFAPLQKHRKHCQARSIVSLPRPLCMRPPELSKNTCSPIAASYRSLNPQLSASVQNFASRSDVFLPIQGTIKIGFKAG